ncbi:MAG: hypothetical protein IPF52_17640 [Saprospiraceae bacterium]|nr:hypothetical protein [Saprospiraceae bacterium]
MDELIRFILGLNYIIHHVVANMPLDKYPSVVTMESEDNNTSYFYKDSIEYNHHEIPYEMLFFRNNNVNIVEIKVQAWPYPVVNPGDVFYFNADEEDPPFLFFYEKSGNELTIRIFENYTFVQDKREDKGVYPVKKVKGSYFFPVLDQFTILAEKKASASKVVTSENEAISFEVLDLVMAHLNSKKEVDKFFAEELYKDVKYFEEFSMINKDAQSCCIKIHKSLLTEALAKPDIAKELVLELTGYEFYGMMVVETLHIYETKQHHLL